MKPTWNLALELDRGSHLPLPQQLVNAVVEGVRRGRLAPGAGVPSTRRLAAELGVHRNTVVAAFDDLVAQGWLETTRASHTRVTRALPERVTEAGRRGRGIGFELGAWKSSAATFEAVPKRVLDFTGGLPDPRLFDSRLLARAYRRALKRTSLDFGSPAGDPVLRARLAAMLSQRRALAVTADDLLVTRGSQLALHLLALAMVRRGDVVAVESPGYPSAREAFSLPGARLLPIPVDAEGLDVEALAKRLRTTRVRALYVTPHHQDPTTVTLSARRRLRLLELARVHRFAVIEADYDYEFQYDAAPVLPMASSDAHGVVVYVGTLSKALAPGLRVGFVAAPRPLLEAMLAVRGQVDRQGDLVLERAVAELLDDGEVLRHSLKARRVFHARRDLLGALLERRLGGALQFELPRGGLALWAKAARGIDVERWARRGLERGVRFFTGRSYSPSGEKLPYLRLGFGHLDERELEEAVRRMATAQ
ncbi:MAG: PLP-dependent aminotransferase family protein [Myxococcaceae bacterium]|nr:PLP-dependent aminotransferase family protein [Myxococcaceae bacterium]